MRKSLWIVMALLVVGAAQVARADSTESFNFSGTLTAGGSITGTFTLDFTTASITAFDFATPVGTVDASNGFGAALNTFTAVSPHTPFVQLQFGTSNDVLALFFQTDLASFSGSTFFTPLVLGPNIGDSGSSRIQCGVFVTACSSPGFAANFISGSATPITTAPEPASLLLLGSGLLGVAGIKLRRSGC